MDAVTGMTDEQIAQQIQDGQLELERRRVVREQEQMLDDMCLAWLEADGRQQGDAFQAPVGLMGAYPRGWQVTRGGKAYEAAVPGALLAPPSQHWAEATEEPIPFWSSGRWEKDARARDAGQVWRALDTHEDGPRPSMFPGGWVLAD